MKLISLPDPREYSDYELGSILIAHFIGAQAEHRGIPLDQVTEEFADQVLQVVLTQEVGTAQNAAIEKALHKAATREYESAGRILRQHMVNNAVAVKFVPIGIKKLKQAAEFGRRGAEDKKSKGAENREMVSDYRKRILANWKSPNKPSDRRMAELIAVDTGIPFNTVRGHLRELNKEKKVD